MVHEMSVATNPTRAATSHRRRGEFHSHQATTRIPSQKAAARGPAIMMKWPPGSAAAALATTSSNARHSPAPAASQLEDSSNATMSPGTARPASGMAARFATTPIGATVPNV